MKTLFGAVVILISTPCVCAYIEKIPLGIQPSPFPSLNDWEPETLDWTPNEFTPKIRIRPMGDLGEPQTRDEEVNINAKAEGIIRREYSAWLKRYGKTRSNKRFAIFKRNFVLRMEMNRKNGEFFLLNEYGDLTENEYIAALRKSKESQIEEETEIKQSIDKKVSAYSDGTHPAAPVKRLEDLTKEVLQSAMEASHKSVTGESESATKPKKINYMERLDDGPVKPKKSLLQKMYAIREPALQDRDNTSVQNFDPSGTRSDTFLESYIDLMNLPMEQPDGFDLLPSLFSAAITSASQTTKSVLIEQQAELESELEGWEAHAYAFDFGDSSSE